MNGEEGGGQCRIRWRNTNILGRKRDDANEQTLLRGREGRERHEIQRDQREMKDGVGCR